MTDEKRNPDGTFKPGHDFATGRPKGSRNKILLALENRGEDAALGLLNTLIDAGMAGDVPAARTVLERAWPPRKPRFPINLPKIETPNDLWKAMKDTYDAVGEGEIALDEGLATLEMIGTMAKNLALSFRKV